MTVTVIVTFLNQVFFSMDGEKRNVEHFYERSLNVTVTVTSVTLTVTGSRYWSRSRARPARIAFRDSASLAVTQMTTADDAA